MTYPKLHFSEPIAEIEWEISVKGWFGGVTVELEEGALYEVNFIDPARLGADLKNQREGKAKGWAVDSFVAEVGMIVIPEVTEAYIRESIQRLYETGWFARFVPLAQSTQN